MSATFAEIVAEGLLIAGDKSLTNRATAHLKKWLRQQAVNFLWPQCKTTSLVTLGSGLSQLSVGAGLGGVTPQIQRINDPLKIYQAASPTFQDFDNIRVQTDWTDAIVNPTASSTAKPRNVTVSQIAATKGAWLLNFDTVSDKAYSLSINSYIVPVDPATSAVPWYPDDETMTKAVEVFALRYKKDREAYAMELDELKSMVSRNRMAEGQKPGVNDGGIQLNSKLFR